MVKKIERKNNGSKIMYVLLLYSCFLNTELQSSQCVEDMYVLYLLHNMKDMETPYVSIKNGGIKSMRACVCTGEWGSYRALKEEVLAS